MGEVTVTERDFERVCEREGQYQSKLGITGINFLYSIPNMPRGN